MASANSCITVFVNPSTTDSRLYMEYYSYKTRHDSHLCLVLSARDGDWLDLFRDQLNELWNDAEPLPLDRGRVTSTEQARP